MTSPEDTLARIAVAAERIAGALESIARTNLDNGPKPKLTVARSPSDRSGLGPLNLATDGTLNAIIQNAGAAETTLVDPTVQIGDVRAVGQIVRADGPPQPGGTVPAAPAGPGVVVIFKPDPRPRAEDSLTLRLPHHPGRYPGITVLEVEMAPMGQTGGRPGWRVTATSEVAQTDA